MKKQVMRRAWEIYRELVGDRIAKLSMAMRQAWAEVKAAAAAEIVNGWNVTALIEAGCNRWKKYGKDRVYLRHIGAALMGLELTYYKSGCISGAWLNGEEISHAEGGRVLNTFGDAYIDLATGKIAGMFGDRYAELFEGKLRAAYYIG